MGFEPKVQIMITFKIDIRSDKVLTKMALSETEAGKHEFFYFSVPDDQGPPYIIPGMGINLPGAPGFILEPDVGTQNCWGWKSAEKDGQNMTIILKLDPDDRPYLDNSDILSMEESGWKYSD